MFLLLFKCTKRTGNFHQALNSLCQMGERTKNGETREKGRTCKHLFKYLSPNHFQKNRLSCQNRNCQNLRVGGVKLSKLINHRVYQKLVYRNEILKTMLTGPTSPSPPSPARLWRNFSRSVFPTIFEPGTGYALSIF